MNQETFKNIETIYLELKKKVASGEITPEVMRRETDQLTVQDTEGRTWRFRENWYVFLNDKWIVADPSKIEIKVKVAAEEKIQPVAKKRVEKSSAKIYKAPFFIAFLVLIAAVTAIFIFLSSGNDQSIDDKKSNDEISTNKTLLNKKDQNQQNLKRAGEYNFLENELQGSAILADEDEKYIISMEDDAKISATVDALKKRIKLIYGIVEEEKKGMTITTIRGKFLGFSLKSTLIYKEKDNLTDETSVITPSKGRIVVKHKKLFSTHKFDFTGFLKDLENAEITVTFTKNIENKQINVRLTILPLGLKLDENLLIQNTKIGKIKPGIDVKIIKSLVPSSYRIISREIKDRYKNYKSYFFHKIWGRDRKPMLTINSKEGSVFKIQVESNRYKTGKGIGIGNTLGDLRAYYNGVSVKQSENFIYACCRDIMNLKFILDRDKVNFLEKKFPDSTRIVSILLEN